MEKTNKLKFGIPGWVFKDPIEKLFKAAGYNLEINEKLSIIRIDDPEIECFFARAKEIAPLIDRGILDGGIVSRAIIAETKVKLEEIWDLGSLKPWIETRVVLAVPEKSSIMSLKDLDKKKIITRLPEITKEFLEKHKISAIIEFSEGNNASRIPVFADAVIEFSGNGTALRVSNLRILAVLMKDSVVIMANPESLKDKWKKEKIENLGLLLKGARLGLEMVGLTLHASNEMMADVLKILPALKKPTVTHLRGENWFEVFTVANERKVREIIPKLKKIGCTGIIEFPLNKVII